MGSLTTLLPVHEAATLWVVGLGALLAGASLYLTLLSLAAFFHRPAAVASAATSRILLLVPAHNEAELIERCVRSLVTQSYPRDLVRLVVVADNCTDQTARLAAAAGAEVLVRDEPTARGKGQALHWALDRLLHAEPRPDAVVVVDADSVADRDLLTVLEAHMAAGADVVQGEYLALVEPGSARSELRAAAFLLFHRTRFAGRSVLGMSCHLVGNGMLFTRRVLEAHPWSAFSSTEDLEYSTDLRTAGVRPVFAMGARVVAPVAGRGRGARNQRVRWEGGRFHVVRTRLPGLVSAAFRTRDWSRLDAAIDLAVPPLGLLTLLVVAMGLLCLALVSVGTVPGWTLVPWVLALAGIPAHVVIGLVAAHAPASAYRALLRAPVFVLAKLGTYARLSRGLQTAGWVRTERLPGSATQPPDRAHRVDVVGVPIDAVDMPTAVSRAMSALGTGAAPLHICTVNLHFLVTAQRDAAVRGILCRSALNVADGAPVLWLARILGRRLPERVTGTDLLPRLMASAAETGARVFLLGGRDGVAAAAGARLEERYPGLHICGVHEPPITDVEAMDNRRILQQIAESRADILVLSLSHPKPEKWIAMHRAQLTVSVAINVGCTLDIITGRRTRAPLWMQRAGMEWLYRLLHEPARLLPRYALDGSWLLFVLLPRAFSQRLFGGFRGAL